jgi:hypothetical protein
MREHAILALAASVVTLCGCTAKPLAHVAFAGELPVATSATGADAPQIEFSADPKYETARGVPLAGDPVICSRDGIFRVNAGPGTTTPSARVSVRPGEEVAVTSVVRFGDGTWQKTCWPLVAFTPQAGAKYVVVNERIGGKGVSALWTGVGRQTCQVSVYKEGIVGPELIETRKPSAVRCQAPAP